MTTVYFISACVWVWECVLCIVYVIPIDFLFFDKTVFFFVFFFSHCHHRRCGCRCCCCCCRFFVFILFRSRQIISGFNSFPSWLRPALLLLSVGRLVGRTLARCLIAFPSVLRSHATLYSFVHPKPADNTRQCAAYGFPHTFRARLTKASNLYSNELAEWFNQKYPMPERQSKHTYSHTHTLALNVWIYEKKLIIKRHALPYEHWVYTGWHSGTHITCEIHIWMTNKKGQLVHTHTHTYIRTRSHQHRKYKNVQAHNYTQQSTK